LNADQAVFDLIGIKGYPNHVFYIRARPAHPGWSRLFLGVKAQTPSLDIFARYVFGIAVTNSRIVAKRHDNLTLPCHSSGRTIKLFISK
jgi:hypothetical protein